MKAQEGKLPLEIERKFLIKMPDVEKLISTIECSKTEITQTYLNSEHELWKRRVRKRGLLGNNKYYYTSKKPISSIKRIEVEEEISEEKYLSLLVEADKSLKEINKTRYCFMWNNILYELDIYPFWNDKAILEVELENEVDEYGNDVTIASKEAQALSVGVVFPGTYFIGRDVNKCVSTTNLEYQFATNMNKPFEGFDGKVFKKLVINTDIVEDLPIFGTRDDLNKKFITAGVSMTKLFDILEIPGQVDLLFGKDAVDYEEVDISDFDLYQRLGSGFAITSKAELKVQGGSDIRVKETPVSDDNRITAINDGIYSMLENLRSDYRVIANGVADGQILGKIPKKVDFKVAKAKDKAIFDGKIIAKAKIDTKDLTDVKKYKFELDDMDEAYNTITEANVYTTNVIKKVANIAELTALDGKIFANGTLFMQLTTSGEPATTVGTLYRYANGSVVKLDDPTANADLVGKLFMADNKVFKGKLDNVGTPTKVEFEQVVLATEFGAKLYVLVESFETVAIYAVSGTTLVPVGELGEVFDDNEDKTLIVVQSENIVDNTIAIKSAALDYTTLEEFVAILNADKTLAKLFSFEVAEASVLEKDDYMSDLIAVLPKTEATAMEDREISYDLSLYIPYKTTDNFARHLAQHCTYTSLKTAPTHGIIGCSKLLDVNLNSIARKVDTLADIDMTLYAKKPNGRDMLDRNYLPYPIGRNISVVVGQYVIDGGNGYNYISNAASGYAGMVSVLPLDQSSTCQPINIPQPQYEFTNYQLGKLTQLGFVTFKQSYTKGFVVTDGITMAPVTSPFRRLSVTRIINSMEELIRAAIEPYIGKQNHLANRNAMQTAIKSALESIKDKLIEAYDFTVTVDPNNAKLGIVDIDYVVVPIFEIREVRNRITVKESMAA
jgi:CYTH domain-containing protein